MSTGERVTAITCAAIIGVTGFVCTRVFTASGEHTIPRMQLVCVSTEARVRHDLLADVWYFRCAPNQGREVPLP